MRRTAFLVYGIVCYAIFFATFLYAIGFIGNVVVPRSVDSGAAPPWNVALAVNTALLAAFALQHSVMARQGFKRWWTRFVPQPVERATYVLASSVCFVALYAFWQPIPELVWSVESEGGHALLTGLYFAGFGLVLYSTFLIDHFELFGLKQVIRHFRGTRRTQSRFVTPSLYKHVRHPLYLGWFTVFWATPEMSVGHLLLAVATTGYILIAVLFEERDLVDEFGETYLRYRETTPAFVPFTKRANTGDPEPAYVRERKASRA